MSSDGQEEFGGDEEVDFTVAPHDKFVRLLLSSPQRTAELLRGHLPTETLTTLDLETLTLSGESFVDDALSESISDLVFHCQLRPDPGDDMPPPRGRREAIVTILIEHKSRPDPAAAFQVLGYIVDQGRRRIREGGHPVPVIPVLFYAGPRAWTVATDMPSYIGGPASLRRYVPDHNLVLIDLSQVDDRQLDTGTFLAACSWLLKYIRCRDWSHYLDSMLERLVAAWSTNPEAPVTAAVVYLLHATPQPDQDKVVDAVKRHFSSTNRGRQMISVAEGLRREGHAEGLQEGLQRGIDRGILIGRLSVCRDELGWDVPIDEKLKEMSFDELEDLMRRRRDNHH